MRLHSELPSNAPNARAIHSLVHRIGGTDASQSSLSFPLYDRTVETYSLTLPLSLSLSVRDTLYLSFCIQSGPAAAMTESRTDEQASKQASGPERTAVPPRILLWFTSARLGPSAALSPLPPTLFVYILAARASRRPFSAG